MTDELFPLFDPIADQSVATPGKSMITDEQRAAIKSAFAELGISDARTQFEVVYELTAQRVTSPLQLEARHAHMLITRLAERVRTLSNVHTGNAWADRDEDTWIDKL